MSARTSREETIKAVTAALLVTGAEVSRQDVAIALDQAGLLDLCGHDGVYAVADSGAAPQVWFARSAGGADLDSWQYRAHLHQCPHCGQRFAQVRTWPDGESTVWTSPWLPLQLHPGGGA